MKRSSVVKALALVLAAVSAIPFLPSGGGQHYTAQLLDQAASATGRLTGGGSGSATFASGTTVSNPPAQSSPTPTGGSFAAALVPPTQKKFFKACARIREAGGATADYGCTGIEQPGNMVDLLLTTGSINFTAPSSFFTGGTLTVHIDLVGMGLYTIGLPPPEILLDLAGRDFEVALSLVLSRAASAVGTITSTSVTEGGSLINGKGVLSRKLNVDVAYCNGPCGTVD